jgi:methylated-DNA-protein-cysteine methyltransferase-like protein
LSGFPTQPRIAGYALHKLPDGIDIPWHRVINAHGRISLTGKSGAEQRRLLEKEGILFVRNVVNMKLFGWRRKY